MSRFKVGKVVRHIASGNLYIIEGAPDSYRLEYTNTPAYAYKADGVTWVRSQAEMEDGRFELKE